LSLLKASDDHERAARSKLHTRARPDFRRLHDALAVQESAEARICIDEQAAPILETKLCMLARDHRPFRLVEDDVALRWVASNLNGRVIVGALRRYGLPVALLYQNDFHDDCPKLIFE
jgi:hypothetical protein